MRQVAKERMVEMRLDGHSIRTIASDVSCSHQMVANYINELVSICGISRPAAEITYPPMSDEERKKTAHAIVECEGDVAEISKMLGKSEGEARAILDYALIRKPSSVRYCIYQQVGAWMRRHMVTCHQFAEDLGIPQATLSGMLSGSRHISMEVLQKIKARTGMTFREILDGHTGPIDEAIRKELCAIPGGVSQAEPPNTESSSIFAEPGKTRHVMPPMKKGG